MDETESHVVGRHRIVLNFRDDVGPASAYSLLLAENIPDLTGKTVVAETTMEQKDHLQLLSADELWSLRKTSRRNSQRSSSSEGACLTNA